MRRLFALLIVLLLLLPIHAQQTDNPSPPFSLFVGGINAPAPSADLAACAAIGPQNSFG